MTLALSKTDEVWVAAAATAVALLAVVIALVVKYRRGVREDEAHDARRATEATSHGASRQSSVTPPARTSDFAAVRAANAAKPQPVELPEGLPEKVVLTTAKGKTKDFDIKISGQETYRLLLWVLALSGKTDYRDIKGKTPLPAGFYWFTRRLAETLGYMDIGNVPTAKADLVLYTELTAAGEALSKELTGLLVTSAQVLSVAYQAYLDFGKSRLASADTRAAQKHFKENGLLPAPKTLHELQSAYQVSGQELHVNNILLEQLLHWFLTLDTKRGVAFTNAELQQIPTPDIYATLTRRIFDLVVMIRNDDTIPTTAKMTPEEVLVLAPDRLTRLFAQYATYLHVLYNYFAEMEPQTDDASTIKRELPEQDIFEELEFQEEIHFPHI